MQKFGNFDAPYLRSRTSFKNLIQLGNSLAIGLQLGVNKYLSACTAVHLLSCKLVWIRCLFDPFQFGGFGSKWPLNGKFWKILHSTDVLWPNLVKTGRWVVAEYYCRLIFFLSQRKNLLCWSIAVSIIYRHSSRVVAFLQAAARPKFRKPRSASIARSQV